MKKLTFTIVIASLFLFFSCSKDNETSGAGTSGALGVTGSGIYYQFAGGYGYYDLRSGRNITEIFKSNIVDKYDVSWDGQKLLVAWAKRPYGQYQTDYLQFTYLPMLEKKSGAASSDNDFQKRKINSFDFNGYDVGGSGGVGFFLSPDERFVAVQAKKSTGYNDDNPASILDRSSGRLLKEFNIDGYEPHRINIVGWSSAGELFLSVGNELAKASESDNWRMAYVKKLPFDDIEMLNMNPQGTQFVFRRGDKHIWLYDIQEDSHYQVTTSKVDGITDARTYYSGGERLPSFSPDGKYIAFTGQPRHSAVPYAYDPAVFGTAAVVNMLIIIENNGKTRDLDADNDGTIFYPKDGKYPISAEQRLIWR